jgi:hypothetical protein
MQQKEDVRYLGRASWLQQAVGMCKEDMHANKHPDNSLDSHQTAAAFGASPEPKDVSHAVKGPHSCMPARHNVWTPPNSPTKQPNQRTSCNTSGTTQHTR